MKKQTFVSLAVITLLVLGALALGMGRLQASAHVQTSNAQAQLRNQQAQAAPNQETQDNGAEVSVTENDPPGTGETTGSVENQGQDQNLPGGGHQDQGQADHQFEGTE